MVRQGNVKVINILFLSAFSCLGVPIVGISNAEKGRKFRNWCKEAVFIKSQKRRSGDRCIVAPCDHTVVSTEKVNKFSDRKHYIILFCALGITYL